jgi:hypothetical protein
VRYVTDGERLFELASDRMMQNFGRLGGWLRVVIVRDASRDERPRELYDMCPRCVANNHPDLWWRMGDEHVARMRAVA